MKRPLLIAALLAVIAAGAVQWAASAWNAPGPAARSGSQTVVLIAPGTSLHQVTPVTRGERLACFFWTQSLVRDAGQRRELFELDQAVRALTAAAPGNPALVQLTGVYHNLLRRWSDA